MQQPFKLILINESLTVTFLDDGKIITVKDTDNSIYLALSDVYTKEEAMDILLPVLYPKIDKENEEIIKKNKEAEVFLSLANYEDFEKVDNSVYMKGINRSLPKLLIEKFLTVVTKEDYQNDDEYVGLKNFWMWCVLNPRAEVADKLYDFLSKNAFRINKQGFFFALRNVVSVAKEGSALTDAISNHYTWKKAVGKNPHEYVLIQYDNKTYESIPIKDVTGKHKVIGNLLRLYVDLPEMANNRFTDAHTRTFDIRVGRLVSMRPEDCSWSNADCAEAGLHFTSNEINYVGCGDTSMIIMINPMKVVGIGSAKGRCYEYLPLCTVPSNQATDVLRNQEFNTLNIENQYVIDELDNLEDRAKEAFSVESSKYEFNLSPLSSKELKFVVSNLNLYKDEVKQRIVNL